MAFPSKVSSSATPPKWVQLRSAQASVTFDFLVDHHGQTFSISLATSLGLFAFTRSIRGLCILILNLLYDLIIFDALILFVSLNSPQPPVEASSKTSRSKRTPRPFLILEEHTPHLGDSHGLRAKTNGRF
jgi:hypothetical protein